MLFTASFFAFFIRAFTMNVKNIANFLINVCNILTISCELDVNQDLVPTPPPRPRGPSPWRGGGRLGCVRPISGSFYLGCHATSSSLRTQTEQSFNLVILQFRPCQKVTLQVKSSITTRWTVGRFPAIVLPLFSHCANVQALPIGKKSITYLKV